MSAPRTDRRPDRRLGVVAVALVAAAVLVDVLATGLQLPVLRVDRSLFLTLSAVRAVVVGLLSVAAVVVACVGVARPVSRTLLAAAGLGGGGVILVGVLSGAVLPLLTAGG